MLCLPPKTKAVRLRRVAALSLVCVSSLTRVLAQKIISKNVKITHSPCPHDELIFQMFCTMACKVNVCQCKHDFYRNKDKKCVPLSKC
uniref:TIL domain-containing protein n=1 Tax=Caenorhabditis japonica TaxID=281687 RepID=A0A8R1EXM0_CAEJA